jgi:hypothetical protein
LGSLSCCAGVFCHVLTGQAILFEQHVNPGTPFLVLILRALAAVW